MEVNRKTKYEKAVFMRVNVRKKGMIQIERSGSEKEILPKGGFKTLRGKASFECDARSPHQAVVDHAIRQRSTQTPYGQAASSMRSKNREIA